MAEKQKTYSIAQFKSGLSAALSEVKKGSEVIVTEHNNPIAKVVRISQIPTLPKVDLAAVLSMKPIKFSKKTTSSAEIIRAIRDEE